MIKVYMVFVCMGFSGIKYFQDKEKAEKFAKENNTKVKSGYCTPHEYITLDF